jgi:hypothetical protein
MNDIKIQRLLRIALSQIHLAGKSIGRLLLTNTIRIMWGNWLKIKSKSEFSFTSSIVIAGIRTGNLCIGKLIAWLTIVPMTDVKENHHIHIKTITDFHNSFDLIFNFHNLLNIFKSRIFWSQFGNLLKYFFDPGSGKIFSWPALNGRCTINVLLDEAK